MVLKVIGTLAAVLFVVACGEGTSAEKSPLCSPDYQAGELTVTRENPVGSTQEPPPTRTTTDAETIRKVARAVCDLPSPPSDQQCTADLGPIFVLRFLDTSGKPIVVRAEAFSCRHVSGLDVQRQAQPALWRALTAAGLPSAG
ncbi:hypothetical protein [Actinokineospora sp.]|uniref:hypothetical protein n=1 Tax=Actinokineospora sp. TaxID=1872133 RepID=UPI003D6B075C